MHLTLCTLKSLPTVTGAAASSVAAMWSTACLQADPLPVISGSLSTYFCAQARTPFQCGNSHVLMDTASKLTLWLHREGDSKQEKGKAMAKMEKKSSKCIKPINRQKEIEDKNF